MFGRIITHRKENIEFYTLKKFSEMVKSHYRAYKVEYTEDGRGMDIYNHGKDRTFFPFHWIASDMEWFDDAEVVTDKNENERVMVWLNVD